MSETMVTKEETPAEGTSVERTRSGRTYSPRFDIWETQEELVLYGDLPGVHAESLEIHFENDVLTIHGKVEPRHNDVEFLFGEYGIGDYYRTFTIGESIDSSKISAEMRHGVLTVHLPKSEAVKPRRIVVKAK